LTAILREAKFEDAELQPFVQMLVNWDGVLSKDSAAAALFEIWQTKLTAQVFKIHVPANAWPLLASRIPLRRTIQALKTAEPRWFAANKSGQDARFGRDAALYRSLKEAVAEAQAKLGDDPRQWRWGALHVALFRHALSVKDEWRKLFDLPAVERSGDVNTVLATNGPNFRQNHGASFREILDVSDWDRSVATNVPGQSGQPGSKHYGDLLPLWAEGRYFPLLFSKQKVEALAKEQLLLEPMK
jgi:penicillin amidase